MVKHYNNSNNDSHRGERSERRGFGSRSGRPSGGSNNDGYRSGSRNSDSGGSGGYRGGSSSRNNSTDGGGGSGGYRGGSSSRNNSGDAGGGSGGGSRFGGNRFGGGVRSGGGNYGGGRPPRRNFDTPPPQIKRYKVSSEHSGATLVQFCQTNFPNVPEDRLRRFADKGSLRIENERTFLDAKINAGQEVSFPETMFNDDPRGNSEGRQGGERRSFDRRDRRDRGDRGDDRGGFGRRRDNRSDDRYGGNREERRAKRREELEYSPKYKILCDNAKTWVVHQDESVVIINKPAGIPVQGGTGIDISIDDLIWVFGKNASLVHRIDSKTSGLLIIALELEAATELGYMFKERKMEKKYYGLVTGTFEQPEGSIDLPIEKMSDGRDREYVRHSDEGKEAITNYRVLSVNDGFSLVEYSIITGRTHQIRVHSAMKGCPILGDYKYSNNSFIELDLTPEQQKAQQEASWMHLHSHNVQFTLFGKKYDVTAELPEYFVKSIKHYNLSA